MNIQLIALDMDGTLLDDDHYTIPQRNTEALRAAAARGVLITIASGRTWSLLTEVAEQLGVVRYAVLSNGAAALDAETGALLYQNGMPQAQCQAITQILLEENMPFEVYCEGQNYLAASQLALLRTCAISPEFMEMFTRKSLVEDDLNGALLGRCIEKFHLVHVPPEKRAALQAKLLDTGPLAITGSTGENMELTAPGVNKGAALAALCQKLQIAPQSVMAFGDAGNDLEMLRWAGHSFAMANASDEAKAAAKFQTGSNRAAGVGTAIEQYLLK